MRRPACGDGIRSKVLTDAALGGKTDRLLAGLKVKVIIGKLIRRRPVSSATGAWRRADRPYRDECPRHRLDCAPWPTERLARAIDRPRQPSAVGALRRLKRSMMLAASSSLLAERPRD